MPLIRSNTILVSSFFVVAARQPNRFMRLVRHARRVNRPKGHIVANNEAPTSQRYDVTATAILGVRVDALLERKVVRATGHAVPSNEDCIPSSRDCRPMSDQEIRNTLSETRA